MKLVSIFVSIVFCLFLLSGCKKNNDTNFEQPPDITHYAQLAIGKWVSTMVDNGPLLTDATFVMELRADKVEFYATGYRTDANNKSWIEEDTYTYSINDDIIVIDGTDVLHKVYHIEMKILTISATTMTYVTQVFKIDNTVYPQPGIYTMKKITEDYSGQFKGVWYGKCTTVSSDTGYHYWEYLASGLYNYYYQDANGKWIKKSDNEGRYFLYGNLFASNYTNDLISGGTGRAYECWNFSIAGETMIWTGLRDNAKTVIYEMKKVASAPSTN